MNGSVSALASGLARYPWLAVVMTLTVLGVQQFGVFETSTLLAQSLHNALHIPLFVGITGALLWAFPRWTLGATLAVAAGLACVSEALQTWTGGQVSGADLLRDGVGIALATWLLRPAQPRLRVAATLTLAATLCVPGFYAMVYLQRELAAPTIYLPDSAFGAVLVEVQPGTGGQFELMRTQAWPAYADQTVLALTWGDTRWPGIHCREPIADWLGYQPLRVDVFNPRSTPQSLTAAVGHEGHRGTARARSQTVTPGHNSLSYAVANLAYSKTGQPARISHLILHTRASATGEQLLLGRVWLE